MSDAVPSVLKTEDELIDKDSVKTSETVVHDRTKNGLVELSSFVKVKSEQYDENSIHPVKQEKVDDNCDSKSDGKSLADLGETNEANGIVNCVKNALNGDCCYTDSLSLANGLGSGASPSPDKSDPVQHETGGGQDPVTLQPVKTCDSKLCVENGVENESNTPSQNGQKFDNTPDTIAIVTESNVANHCGPTAAGKSKLLYFFPCNILIQYVYSVTSIIFSPMI